MEHEKISYYVHEGMMARMERTNRRLWILCIIIFLAFVISNGAWIWYENQWEVYETSQSVDQDINTGDGDANITGIGDIYGTSEADD